MMADAIGAKLDRITFDVTFTPATEDSDLGFMQIPKGTVASVYGYHRGWVGDKNVVSVGFNWIMGEHVTPPKPVAHGHVIQVFGVPNMRTVVYCLPSKDWSEVSLNGLGMIYTALPVTNAVRPWWPPSPASSRSGSAAGHRAVRPASAVLPRRFSTSRLCAPSIHSPDVETADNRLGAGRGRAQDGLSILHGDAGAHRAATDMNGQHRAHVGHGQRLQVGQPVGECRRDLLGAVRVVDVVHDHAHGPVPAASAI